MRPRDYDEFAQGEELWVILPSFHVTEGVSAEYEKEAFTLSHGAMIVRDRLYGVRFSFTPDLDIGKDEQGVFGNGQFDHLPAMSGGYDGAIHLVRRRGGQDEDHLAQIEGFPDLLGTTEMPEMYRVKGSTKKSYPFRASPKRS
jgi:hypothetical protein